jgi:hypothetical protein
MKEGDQWSGSSCFELVFHICISNPYSDVGIRIGIGIGIGIRKERGLGSECEAKGTIFHFFNNRAFFIYFNVF